MINRKLRRIQSHSLPHLSRTRFAPYSDYKQFPTRNFSVRRSVRDETIIPALSSNLVPGLDRSLEFISVDEVSGEEEGRQGGERRQHMRDKGDAGPHVLLLQQQRVEERHGCHLRHIKPVHQQRSDMEQLRLADLPAKAQVRSSNAQRIGLHTRPVAHATQELANYHDSGREHQRNRGIRVLQPAHHHRYQFK